MKLNLNSISFKSNNQKIFYRLITNPLAIISGVVILIFVSVAILGYLISPDSSSYANEQHLELAIKQPMFKVKMLIIHDKPEQKYSLLHEMLFGLPIQTTNIPIYQYRINNGILEYETFTGETPNNGQILKLSSNTKYEIKNKTYFLGTDRYGRCLLSQLMIGSRVSLAVGFIAIIIALVIGISLGSIAGYYGGILDKCIMWFINVVWSIPTVLLVIAITFALGKGFWQVFVAVGLTMWVDIARLVRGQVISLKEQEFVLAGKALGFSDLRLIFSHILPNIVSALAVVIASNFSTAILQEAGLSFLGLGVQPPMPSWGCMIKENYGYIILDAAYLAIVPGLAIMLLVLSFFLLSTAIRTAMDIKQ